MHQAKSNQFNMYVEFIHAANCTGAAVTQYRPPVIG